MFRARCASCGDVSVEATVVKLLLEEAGGVAAYEVACPRCHLEVREAVEPATAELLQALGATMFVVPAAATLRPEGLTPQTG